MAKVISTKQTKEQILKQMEKLQAQLNNINKKQTTKKTIKNDTKKTTKKIIKKKKITVFGKKINYKNIPDLSHLLNLGEAHLKFDQRRLLARKVLERLDKDYTIHDVKSGEFAKIRLEDKPVIVRDFINNDRIPKYIKDEILVSDNAKINFNNREIKVKSNSEEFGPDDILALTFSFNIRIIISSQDGTKKTKSVRNVSGSYVGPVGPYRDTLSKLIIQPEAMKYSIAVLPFTEANIKDRSYYLGKYVEDVGDNDVIQDIEGAPEEIRYTKLGNFVRAVVSSIMEHYDFVEYILIEPLNYDTDIISTRDKKAFNLETMTMQANKPDDISTNLFNEIVDLDNGEENCVIYALEKKYPKLPIKKYFSEKYNIDNGINTNAIIEFCKDYGILCVAYSRNGDVIKKYTPVKKLMHKPLYYIAYNNHIYVLANKKLNAKHKTYKSYVKMDKDALGESFAELVKNGIIPNDIKIYYDDEKEKGKDGKQPYEISSYIHQNVLYFYNNDFDLCMEILKLYGVEHLMTPTTTRFNIMKIIESIYNIENNTSFFPQLKNVTITPPLFATNKKIKDTSNIESIDKVRMYWYALSELPYLIKIDIRIEKVNENPTRLVSSYLYNVIPEKSTLLLPSTGIYPGYHLIECLEEGIKFHMCEEYTTKTVENKYKKMTEDYFYKTQHIKDTDTIKQIGNIFAGKMARGCDDVTHHNEAYKFCNNNERELTNGCYVPYDDKYSFCIKSTRTVSIYTRKVILLQLISKVRMILYRKMCDIGLVDTDIVQIKTDSISFIKRAGLKDVGPLDRTKFDGWKPDKYKPTKDLKRYTNDPLVFLPSVHNQNYIYTGYAGCGKTYKILNDIIPKIQEKNKNFIVLSPSHSTIEEFRLHKDINCAVTQKYTMSKKIPLEEVIILDEIGLCDKSTNDTIYKCWLLGKQILSFGDFRQLLPVGENQHLDSDSYLNLFYKYQKKIVGNRRNNFTAEYYDSLIYSKNSKFLLTEIEKHMTKYYNNAEAIICSTNVLRKIWNDKMLKHLGIEFGDIGCKVTCKTNLCDALRDQSIFNNSIFTVTDKDDDKITLDNKYIVSNKIFFGKSKENSKVGNFEAGYARTAYNVQAHSLKSYYIPADDRRYFCNGRRAYTVISRLKQELSEHTKMILDNNERDNLSLELTDDGTKILNKLDKLFIKKVDDNGFLNKIVIM